MATWRDDIDALEFRPAGHQGSCMVHRLALRTLIGHSAARDKIARAALSADANFDLTSREITAQGRAISG